MLKRKLFQTVSVLMVAAIAGILLGRYYIGSVAGTAKAEGDTLQAPAWQDLEVIYLGPMDSNEEIKGFDPAAFARDFNAQTSISVAELAQQNQSKRPDVLIIGGKSVLSALDTKWAAEQYMRGTAFVGLNITAEELGTVINDPDFAAVWGNNVSYPEPYLSYTVVRISGNPEHIKLLEANGALYPPDGDKQVELGVTDVSISFSRGYMPVSAEGLAYDLSALLDELRFPATYGETQQ
jgi:hypothetical protein